MPTIATRPPGAHRLGRWRRMRAAWNRFWRLTTPRGAAEYSVQRKHRHGV